jgi:hypothetical protein
MLETMRASRVGIGRRDADRIKETDGAGALLSIRFSIIKGNDNGCANISISLNLESMQVNLFDTIQTSRKIVYTSVFVTLTAFVDNVLSFNLESQK